MADGAAPTLNKWWIVELDGRDLHLVGYVSGHPTLRDGGCVVTSRVIWLDEPAGAVCTVSHHYHLGQKGVGPLPNKMARHLDKLLTTAWHARRTNS